MERYRLSKVSTSMFTVSNFVGSATEVPVTVNVPCPVEPNTVLAPVLGDTTPPLELGSTRQVARRSLAPVTVARTVVVVLAAMMNLSDVTLMVTGGTVMVQDQASSVVWGMPGAVAAADLASGILSPRQIAYRLLLRGAVE